MTSTAALIHRRPRVVHDADRIDWTNGGLFVLCAILALGWIDSMDDADHWKREATKAHAEVAKREALESMPNPVVVIDAHSAEQFGLRLAEIAGGLDGVRAEMRRK